MTAPFLGIIEKGIPLPHSKRGDGSLRERMSALSVRDSFETNYSIAGVHQMARKLNIQVETRKSGAGRIRVWRVEKDRRHVSTKYGKGEWALEGFGT